MTLSRARVGGRAGSPPEGEGAGVKRLALCRYLRSLGVAFDGVNSSDQGCLHKAAQRGHRAVCEW